MAIWLVPGAAHYFHRHSLAVFPVGKPPLFPLILTGMKFLTTKIGRLAADRFFRRHIAAGINRDRGAFKIRQRTTLLWSKHSARFMALLFLTLRDQYPEFWHRTKVEISGNDLESDAGLSDSVRHVLHRL
jgi:hypothetical protein